MRIRDHRDDDIPHIDLVPLIDVILVLIIFFVVTTTFDARSVLKLELPHARGEASEAQPRTLAVLVNAQGRYFVGDAEVVRTDVDSLKQALRDAAGERRDAPVLLRADARTPYQSVVTAYDALGQLGFTRIHLATAPEAARQ